MGIWNFWIKHYRKGIQNTEQWMRQTWGSSGHWVWFQKNKFPSSMGTGLGGYQVRHEVPQGGRWRCCGQMAPIFVSVVHSEGQSQNSSPPACLLWCVLDKTSTNEIATQIQGCICRWDQQYFLLRLQSFYRHQPAKVPKVFMKFIAWTIKKTWVWAEWLWMKNTGLLWGKESSPNNLIWETISA